MMDEKLACQREIFELKVGTYFFAGHGRPSSGGRRETLRGPHRAS